MRAMCQIRGRPEVERPVVPNKRYLGGAIRDCPCQPAIPPEPAACSYQRDRRCNSAHGVLAVDGCRLRDCRLASARHRRIRRPGLLCLVLLEDGPIDRQFSAGQHHLHSGPRGMVRLAEIHAKRRDATVLVGSHQGADYPSTRPVCTTSDRACVRLEGWHPVETECAEPSTKRGGATGGGTRSNHRPKWDSLLKCSGDVANRSPQVILPLSRLARTAGRYTPRPSP